MTAETRTLVMERDLPHPPAKVWRALTETALLEDWMMKNDFQAVVGHTFTFYAPPSGGWNGHVTGEVLEVEPQRRLQYAWTPAGGDPRVTGWIVTLTLEATPAGTHLRMEQAGFKQDQDAAYQGAKYGWEHFLPGLERVLGRVS